MIYRRWEILADAMEDSANALDVGCGSGGFLTHLQSRRPNMRLIGCDISAAAVEKARQAGFEAFVLNPETTPLPGTFDNITGFAVRPIASDDLHSPR